ncbi:unnamed protein product [Spodoptera exigua]|nr:unnamed protein product [Spodoptera exigua]
MRSQSLYILFWAIFCGVVIPRKLRRPRETISDSDSSEDISESVDLQNEHHGMSIDMLLGNKNTQPLRHKKTKTLNYITVSPPFLAVTKAPPDPKLPRGPFFGFLRNICNALISPKFKVKHLGKYFHILSKSLKGFGINFIQKIWIRRFRRKLKKYSIYNKKKLKSKAKAFLDFISDGKPKKIAYFAAMDAIYSVDDDRKMDDYVYLLKNYGKGVVRHIGAETRRIFERIIFGRYDRLDENRQDKIELKFKSAVIEYWENRLNRTNYNSTLDHLFNFPLNQP